MTPQTMQSSLNPINRAQLERVVAARVPYISQGGSWLLSDLRNIRAAPLIKKSKMVTATQLTNSYSALDIMKFLPSSRIVARSWRRKLLAQDCYSADAGK